MKPTLVVLDMVSVVDANAEPGKPGALPPSEFLLFKKGKHTSEKGTFVFDEKSAKSVMQAAKRKGHDIPIDYEHNMVLPNKDVPGDGPTPAAGWFSLEVRDDGLWATNVRWTDRARTYLTSKEYRFMSPAFLHVDGHIEELINVALTNTPAQHNQTPLVAASAAEHTTPKEPPAMKHLLATLKLSESAAESEAVSVVTVLQADRTKLLEATGKKDVEGALGVIAALKDSEKKLDAAQKELLAVKAQERVRKVQRLVAQGVKSMKIPPAMKDQYIAMGMNKNGLKFLKSYLESARPLVSTKKLSQKKLKGDDGAPAQDEAALKQVAQKMGISLKDLKKSLAAQSA